jgi:hypothetical protein
MFVGEQFRRKDREVPGGKPVPREERLFTEIAKAELPESFPIMAVDTKFYWLSPRLVAQEKP